MFITTNICYFTIMVLLSLYEATAIVLPVPANPPPFSYVGTFYTPTVKSFINSTYNSYPPSCLGVNDTSHARFQSSHTTIVFNASSYTTYEPFYNSTQTSLVLGVAHDTHGQALLVNYRSNSGGTVLQSTNIYPHITLSVQGSGIYSAVYSNTLWSRIIMAGFVKITSYDSFGKPLTIAINRSYKSSSCDTCNKRTSFNMNSPAYKHANIVSGTLPAVTISGNIYELTPFYAIVFNTYKNPRFLTGTVCVSSAWDFNTGKCHSVGYNG